MYIECIIRFLHIYMKIMLKYIVLTIIINNKKKTLFIYM